MQQIVFKREFSFLFDEVKTENVQYSKEKIQPIKKIVIEKIQKKRSLKIWILRNPERFSKKFLRGILASYLEYLHTKYGINKTSRLVVRLYTERQADRFTDKLFVLLLLKISKGKEKNPYDIMLMLWHNCRKWIFFY